MSPRPCGARSGTILLGTALMLTSVTPLAGQVPDSVAPPPPPTPPATGGWAAYVALPHPWSTVVALTVVIPVGSERDAEDLAGTAWLLGETSAAAVRERLGEGTVRVEVDVNRSRTVFRVLTGPEAWVPAYRALEDVLFDGSAALAPGLDERRASLLAIHTFEAGAPVREFEREVYRMLDGAGSAWSQPPRGNAETLELITATDLSDFRRRHYDRADAVLSVTGAVDPDEAALLVTGERSPEDIGAEPRLAVRVEPTRPPGPAWTEGDRVHLVRDVTSGWIAAAYPLDPGTPRTAAEMLVHRIRSELVTEPPAPGLFSAEVSLEALPDDHAGLLVRVAVVPESVEVWESRIVDTMARVAAEPLQPGFFRFHRRQFRNLRLVEDAAPEEEGLRMAMDLRRTGGPRSLDTEIREMDADALYRAASSLGPARILVFGPDLAAEGRTPE